jgi:hypothetical protein
MVDHSFWIGLVEILKMKEVLVLVCFLVFPTTSYYVERRKGVVVPFFRNRGAALDGQTSGGVVASVECLYLALLINGQDQSFLRRV